jgi:hypothetical protein
MQHCAPAFRLTWCSANDRGQTVRRYRRYIQRVKVPILESELDNILAVIARIPDGLGIEDIE